MNHATLQIGDKTSVAGRISSNNSHIRPCKLLDIECENFTNGTLYLHYFDNVTAAPVTGTVPTDGFPVAANSGGTLGTPRDIMGGYAAWSSTESTFTAAGVSGSIIFLLKGGS